MAIGIANGVLREISYGRITSELHAHQLSTILLMLFTGVFVWFLNRHWPIVSLTQAWSIGFAWLILTISFEFGFGRYIMGHSWARLIADYNVLDGRMWLLFLAWILIIPVIIYRLGKNAA